MKISTEAVIQIQAVVHPPGAAGYGWSPGARFALNGAARIFGCGIESLQFEARKRAALLRGVDEGEDDGLGLLLIDCLGGGKLTAVAGRDEPVEVALHDGWLHFVIGGDKPLGERGIVWRPGCNVGADAQRALHGAQHPVGQ